MWIASFLRRRLDAVAAGVAGLLSVLVHLVPFLLYGPNPLGYDTGFYRRYLIEPLSSFPNTPVPGLGGEALVPRVVLDALRVLHIPTDLLLYGSYIVVFALVPTLFYFVLKPTLGARGAVVGAVLLALSPVQYTAYWYMLLKNAWGLVFLLLALIAWKKKSFWLLLGLDFLLALSHKTTALVYVATLSVLGLIYPKRLVESALHGVLVLVCLAAVALPALQTATHDAPVAMFLGWGEYISLSLPFFIAILFGIRGVRRSKIPNTLFALLIVGAAFPVLQLPFFERVFIFSDIGVCALAAIALEYVIARATVRPRTNSTYWHMAALCIVGGAVLGTLWNQIQTQKPLVSVQEIGRIEEIARVLPPDATMLTTTDEAPWFEGWTTAHIAAPGMLRDIHNFDEWVAYWESTSTPYKISFLSEYPQPLYISTGQDYQDLASSTCMTRLLPTLLRDDCAQKK